MGNLGQDGLGGLCHRHCRAATEPHFRCHLALMPESRCYFLHCLTHMAGSRRQPGSGGSSWRPGGQPLPVSEHSQTPSPCDSGDTAPLKPVERLTYFCIPLPPGHQMSWSLSSSWGQLGMFKDRLNQHLAQARLRRPVGSFSVRTQHSGQCLAGCALMLGSLGVTMSPGAPPGSTDGRAWKTLDILPRDQRP